MISLLSKIIKLNNLLVIGVVKNDEGENYNVLTVKKKANKIDVISIVTFDTFVKLTKSIDAKLPILLVIDGKGVLNKEIDFNNEADINWQKNIDYDTIFHTSVKGDKNSFISFCRKNIVEDTVARFNKKGLQVVDIYIGAFLGALLSNTIKKESIISNDLILEFENEKLVKFRKGLTEEKKQFYVIDKKSITSPFLPLYGALIDFFVPSKEVSKTQNTKLNIEEILYKKAFNFFGITILVGFLIALLTSYILIQHYGAKNAELNLQNVYSNQSYQLILDLEKQKIKKQDILKESGVLSSKFLSFYAYEIIKEIPDDISLTLLNVTPSNKETKSNQKINFEVKTIIVKGETFKESSFNNWMENLKKMKWLQHFEIISLKKDKKNKSQFEIKIKIKDV